MQKWGKKESDKNRKQQGYEQICGCFHPGDDDNQRRQGDQNVAIIEYGFWLIHSLCYRSDT